jgi:hypothetical protein
MTPRVARRRSDEGAALLLALIVTLLCLAIGAGVVAVAAIEVAHGGASRAAIVADAAADAAAERALHDLGRLASWNAALAGAVQSSWSGGPTLVTVPGHGTIDLAGITVQLQAASDAFVRRGADNPRWQLFAWGWLGAATGDGPARGLPFSAVWVFDDPGEADTDPEADSNGRVGLYAMAFGPLGVERAVELTVAQITDPVGARVIAWRAIR